MLNKLLQNQLEKRAGEPYNLPAGFMTMLKAVDETSEDHQNARKTLEQSLAISSAEIIELNRSLKEANRELNNLFNNIEEVLYTMDTVTFKITQITAGCHKLYGYTPEEFYADAQIWMKVMHPDDHHQIQKYVGVQPNDTSRVQINCRIIRKDNTIRWIESSGKPTFDAQGNVVRIDGVVRDVTEQKVAKDALKQSELMFREFFESAPQAVNIVDLETGKFVDFNTNILKLLKYSSAEFLTLGPADISPAIQPDGKASKAKAMEMIALALEGKECTFEWIHIDAEGRHFPCEVRLSRLSVTGKNYLLGSMVDITEKKEAEKGLKESSARLKKAQEVAHLGSWELNFATGVALWSEEACRIYGLPPDKNEYSYRQWIAFVHPEDLEQVSAEIKRSRESLSPSSFDHRIIRPDGTIRFVHSECIFQFNTEGIPVGLYGIAHDITERKKAEELLLQSEANLRTIFETADVGFLLMDTGYNVVASNDMISQWSVQSFGAPLAQGMNLRELLMPDKLPEFDGMMGMIAAGQQVEYDTQYPDLDGSFKWIHVNGKPVKDKSEKVIGLCLSLTNITLHKNSEEEIARLNESLEEKVKLRTEELVSANKELESFSYSVSHDLRAPLRVINGYAKMMQKSQQGKIDEQGEADLLVIMENAARMGNLIDDLLDFSRLGRACISKNTVNMTGMVKVVIEEVKTATGAYAEIQLQDFEPSDCDPALMKQVWTNLISNAFKYSRKKDKPVIEIGATGINGHRTYYVKDNGAGFDMQHADKLFAVFQRLHKVTEYEGTGVGLALVQRIIHKHGGKIWADAKVDEGATFYFTLA